MAGTGRGQGWNRLSDEVRLEIRRRRASGMKTKDVAKSLGVSKNSVLRVVREAGGVPPRPRSICPARLQLADREEIMLGVQRGDTNAVIAAAVSRDSSTVSREISRNGRSK